MHSNETDKPIEVLIVGAGPAGLMMACQLALQGIRFRIIDKKTHPTPHSGALIIHARTIEILHQMGVAQKAISQGIIAQHLNILFNGKSLFTIAIKDIGAGLSRFPYLLMLKQSKTEQLLTEFINEHGFAIERNLELLYLDQDKTGVTSQIRYPDGKIETVKTHYLIAADGGKSIIRQQLNIPFIGKTHQKSLFIIDCKTDTKFSEDEVTISFSDKTVSGFFPLSNGKWRVDGIIPKGLATKEVLTFEDIEEHFSERIRMDTKLYAPEWFSVFHSHQHHAATFQKGRCFLIGDAAHIHNPVGAQGMNTGIQDAYNLSWKLSQVIKGKAKPELLDTYTIERLPVAKNTIRSTDFIYNLLTSDNLLKRAFRIYISPIIGKTLFPVIARQNWIRRFAFKAISEIGIHYRESILSYQPSIRFLPSYSLRPGDRLPFIRYNEYEHTVNIQDKINGTGFHLFIFSKQLPSKETINLLEKHNDILSFETLLHSADTEPLFRKLGISKQGLLLIRPDSHIAFISDKLNYNYLENYLHRFIKDLWSKNIF